MSDKVRCAIHGEADATYVYCHIVNSLDTGKAVGFNSPADIDGDERPDAWCRECNEVCRPEGGEWTDKALEFVQVNVLCGGCDDSAKAIWPRIVRRWLASKTPENLAAWIVDPDASMLLAVEDNVVLAVGAVRNDGEITLNYVSPAARFRGASSALLAALETRARERGNTHCYLLSTETAHRFYLDRGYLGHGEPQHKFGTSSSYPMSKKI